MSSSLRPTLLADTATLLAITQATGKFKPLEIEALAEVLADYHAVEHAQGHCCVTLEEDGEIAGFAYYAPAPMTDRSWQLWWIVVRAGRQGGGLGGKLLHQVENDIAAKKGRLIFIETASVPQYENTRRFYRKHGYEQHALLKDYYAAGDSMVVFRKELKVIGVGSAD